MVSSTDKLIKEIPSKRKFLKANRVEIRCKCGTKITYLRTVDGKFSLIPAELICTKCGEILKVKDFINGN